ncbi:MAG: hypothetical protein HYU35_01345 [Parcubacteria group bacterium]|nr:hypothetical protein [Parcubacteria group bacterium]
MNWISGLLGIWVIVEQFLGFSPSASRILLVITGVVIAVLAFWPKGSDASSLSSLSSMGGGEKMPPPSGGSGAGTSSGNAGRQGGM